MTQFWKKNPPEHCIIHNLDELLTTEKNMFKPLSTNKEVNSNKWEG